MSVGRQECAGRRARDALLMVWGKAAVSVTVGVEDFDFVCTCVDFHNLFWVCAFCCWRLEFLSDGGVISWM